MASVQKVVLLWLLHKSHLGIQIVPATHLRILRPTIIYHWPPGMAYLESLGSWRGCRVVVTGELVPVVTILPDLIVVSKAHPAELMPTPSRLPAGHVVASTILLQRDGRRRWRMNREAPT